MRIDRRAQNHLDGRHQGCMAASQSGRLCAGPPWRSAEGRVSGSQHHHPLQQQLRSGTQDCQATLALLLGPINDTTRPQFVSRSGVALQQHVCNAVCPQVAGCHAQFALKARGQPSALQAAQCIMPGQRAVGCAGSRVPHQCALR